MLILNNGIPKSGSTWVHRILRIIGDPQFPSDEWRNEWTNPSVALDRLEAYCESEVWHTHDQMTLLKMHFINDGSYTYLKQPGIKMVISFREIPESTLSWFHHQIRIGQTSLDAKDEWFQTAGLNFARRIVRHRNSWQGFPNTLFMSYEQMLANPGQEIARLADFVGIALTPGLIDSVVHRTSVSKKDYKTPQEGNHIRTAGVSRVAEELPPEIIGQLREISEEAMSFSELSRAVGQ